MSAVQRSWDFVKEHWRALGVASVAGGGLFAFFKYQPQLKELWQQYKVLKALEAQMKASPSREQQALRKDLTFKMERNMRVGDVLVKNFCKSAKLVIDGVFYVDRLRANLQKGAKRSEDDLKVWQQFNHWAFARTITSVYALCLLNFLVKVQLSIVSRYVTTDESLYAAAVPPGTAASAEEQAAHRVAAEKVNTIFLGFASYAEAEGLKRLCAAVLQAVVEATASYQLNSMITPKHLSTILLAIREKVGNTNLASFCVSNEKNEEALCTALVQLPLGKALDAPARLSRMWHELQNVLATQSARAVLQQSLDAAFEWLERDLQDAWTDSGETVSFMKLAMRCAKAYSPIMDSDHSWLVQQLSAQQSVPQFCSVVFFPLELTLSPETAPEAPPDDMAAFLQLMNGIGATDAEKEAISAILRGAPPPDAITQQQ